MLVTKVRFKMTETKTGLDFAEIEKNIPSQINIVLKVVQDKHGIIVPEKCNQFIARCIRLKDGNLEKAVKLVKAFYSVSGDIFKWNATLQPSYYQNDWYGNNGMFPVVSKDSLGRRVVIARATKWNHLNLSFDDLIVGSWLMAQFMLRDNVEYQRHGFVFIWDLADLSIQQVWAVNKKRLLTLATWVQNAVIGRMKEFHAVNHPRIVHLIYASIKPLLSEKIKKRIQLHNSLESLHGSVDPKLLPTFLGGKLPVEESRDHKFMDGLLHSGDFFQDMVNNRFPNA